MSYFKISSKVNELKHITEIGNSDVLSTGIASLEGLVGLKVGYPIFVGGAPFSGKTEFVFELLINTSKLYKWNHFIYCGEGGNAEHIFSELVHKYMGKPYLYMTESEKISAEAFIDAHFVLADHDKDYTIDGFYELVKTAEDELGIKFNTTTFDPFNDAIDESDKYGGRDDKYLASVLKKVRVSSKINNRIDIVVNHIADVKPIQDKDTQRFYTRPALPNEWAGGRTWWRRAFTMILVYRPPTFLRDDQGRPFGENESHIIIQKSKPKGVGKIGLCSIFWDWKKNQYYSFNNAQLYYSCEYVPKKEELKQNDFNQIPVNNNFLNEDPF